MKSLWGVKAIICPRPQYDLVINIPKEWQTQMARSWKDYSATSFPPAAFQYTKYTFCTLCCSLSLQWKDLPLHSNGDFSSCVIEGVEPALHEKSPLQTKGGNQEVKAHSTEAVAFQESHEETKSHKDHDMHILEAWSKEHTHFVNEAWTVMVCNKLHL